MAGLLDGLVYEYFSYLQQNPEFVQLLSWENSRGALGMKQIKIGDVIAPIVHAVSNTLGDHTDDVDARYLVMSCLALCSYYFTNRHTLSVVFDMDLDDPTHMQRWLEHVRQLIVSDIHNRCKKSKRSSRQHELI